MPPAKDSDGERLAAELQRVRPGAEVGTPHATPIAALFGVEMPGGNVIYGTADGSHIIAGDLYALDAELVNLTEAYREERRRMSSAERAPADVFNGTAGRPEW